MVSHTHIKLTMEQAAALRVIFKLEFVGKTGNLLKKSKDKDENVVLSYVVRNAEIWSKLDNTIHSAMWEVYRNDQASLNIKEAVDVALPHGMLETIQGILREGEYLATLTAAKSDQQSQLTLGSMVHLVIVERSLEALKLAFNIQQKPAMVFWPMKAAEGKN